MYNVLPEKYKKIISEEEFYKKLYGFAYGKYLDYFLKKNNSRYKLNKDKPIELKTMKKNYVEYIKKGDLVIEAEVKDRKKIVVWRRKNGSNVFSLPLECYIVKKNGYIIIEDYDEELNLGIKIGEVEKEKFYTFVKESIHKILTDLEENIKRRENV